MDIESTLSQSFLTRSKYHLQEDFLPRIRRCLEELSDGQIWWRAHENMNSIGNLMLHLNGNLRQWIISGVGGAADTRRRELEFSERSPLSREELLTRLESTVREAMEVLDSVRAEMLLEKRKIQIYEVTGLEAIFHVVEHFSYHTGQIVLITRLVRNLDLKFYRF